MSYVRICDLGCTVVDKSVGFVATIEAFCKYGTHHKCFSRLLFIIKVVSFVIITVS
jgi:hypothetical protein